MTEHLKVDITCETCGFEQRVNYEVSAGVNTLEWICPRCKTKRVSVRKVLKTGKKDEGNFPRLKKT